jgi:hypothetical protein
MIVIPNRVRVVVLFSALALAAGLLMLALQAKPAQAQAETSTSTERVPFTFTGLTNPCTGETFFVEGTQLLVFHSTLDADGGEHFYVDSTFEGRGVSDSGAKYVFHETNPTHTKLAPDSANNFTSTATGSFIRQGSATPEDDFVIKLMDHITINANGEVTSLTTTMEIECQ